MVRLLFGFGCLILNGLHVGPDAGQRPAGTGRGLFDHGGFDDAVHVEIPAGQQFVELVCRRDARRLERGLKVADTLAHPLAHLEDVIGDRRHELDGLGVGRRDFDGGSGCLGFSGGGVFRGLALGRLGQFGRLGQLGRLGRLDFGLNFFVFARLGRPLMPLALLRFLLNLLFLRILLVVVRLLLWLRGGGVLELVQQGLLLAEQDVMGTDVFAEQNHGRGEPDPVLFDQPGVLAYEPVDEVPGGAGFELIDVEQPADVAEPECRFFLWCCHRSVLHMLLFSIAGICAVFFGEK